jgi:putative RNA 2'-phosphotransferase
VSDGARVDDAFPQVRLSKFLSLVLRHHPERIGLLLDREGWADVEDLLTRARAAGVPLTRKVLEQVVRDNDKQRFALDVENGRIRANQGHSVEVDLGLATLPPPPLLYHGTARGSLASIRRSGLRAGSRRHVHLSATPETARTVGSRHGVPVVLTVESGRMADDGRGFYRSANGVWLTDRVDVDYLVFPPED